MCMHPKQTKVLCAYAAIYALIYDNVKYINRNKREYAVLENQDGMVYITAKEGITFVNGKEIHAKEAKKLQHRDRLEKL